MAKKTKLNKLTCLCGHFESCSICNPYKKPQKKKKLKKYVVTVVEKVAYYFEIKARSYAHAEQVLDKLRDKGEAESFYDKDLGSTVTVEEV